jgi:hypothetical protein
MPYERLLYTGTFTPAKPIRSTKAIIKYFFWAGFFASLNFSCTFVVRSNFINHEATHHKQKSETKKKGRRTVASTAVLSVPRMELLRGDLPPLFNIKSFNMRSKRDDCTKSAEIGTYVPEIKNLHAGSRQSVINGLFNRPINQLVHDFMVEMDAKNTAYYFISENGHFDAFADYCKNSRKEVCHANS